jgi:selenocysteine lyase/cysteine desulfurase
LQPEELPHRLEAGTPNTAGIAGLGEGVRFIQEHAAEMAGHELKLASRLWEALEGLGGISLHGQRPGGGPRTGVVSFTVDGHTASEIGAIDSSFDIAVRAGLHCAPGTHRSIGTFPEGTVRVSPGPFTKEDHIDSLTAALSEISG